MQNVTDRIARYLLRRVRHKAIHDLYRRAEAACLMESRFIVPGDDQSGQAWSLTAAGARLLNADASAGNNAFERALRRGCLPAANDSDEFGDGIDPGTVRSIPKGRLAEETAAADTAATAASDATTSGIAGRFEQLRAMRRHVAPPSIADGAVALLVARAVGNSVGDLPALLDTIGRTSVMIALRVPVNSFERHCALALERGLILPFKANLVDGVGGQALTGRFRDNPADAHRMTAFSGKHIRKKDDDFGPELLTRALLKPSMPVILIDEASADLPLRMAAAPDLVLASPEIDRAFVAELMQVCLGITPKLSLAAMNKREFEPRALSIDDLVVALRSGRSAERMIAILQKVAAANEASAGDDDEDKSAGRSRQASKPKKTNEPNFEIVQPRKADGKPDGKAGTTTDRVLLVEDLAGYGAARDWALDLRSDLALWREGQLGWAEMSTKLLLSGPPGTGKTTYARALCNTLQVPMLATSVAQWLEPGYLGDVLKCMSAAFDTARKHAPAILFVDEIDGIGGRSNSARSHADYWDSVVNRALELLDGVGRSEGVVVVGATNNPDRIDPALRRSGRLERHIVIPQPDSAALIGILAHHLGDDLARILESRPPTTAAIEIEPATPRSILSPLGLTIPEIDDTPKGSRT
jgi:hypothetical protein